MAGYEVNLKLGEVMVFLLVYIAKAMHINIDTNIQFQYEVCIETPKDNISRLLFVQNIKCKI